MKDVEDEWGNCEPIDPERAYVFLLDSKGKPYIAKIFYDRSSARAYTDNLEGGTYFNIIIADSKEGAIKDINAQIKLKYCNFMKLEIDQNILDSRFEDTRISRLTKRINRYLAELGDPRTVIITINGEAEAQERGANLIPGDVIVDEEYGEIIIPDTDINGQRITVENSNDDFKIEYTVEAWGIEGDVIPDEGEIQDLLNNIVQNIEKIERLIKDFERCESFDDYDEYVTRITEQKQKYIIYEDSLLRYLEHDDSDYESGPE